ncbi:MAG TPA: GTP-binding protein [Propionibacterium sp.]|nr:GTP-binding protein [Propionibacterium sp.]
MSPDARADAAALVASARRLFADDPDALGVLDDLDRRLAEPLRLALAGIVKAGKSTLLNALLGERIAPTDAGECTRIVTWYRWADTPSVTAHLTAGPARRLPVRRSRGMLVIALGDLPAEEVDRIEVGWPSAVLRSMTLIDTPGIESLSLDVSARSAAFLTPEDNPSSADAIVYLMRHLHPSDLGFLEAFRDTAAGEARTVNAVAVLSRADEIGSGRIDSLLSAGKVAARYEREGDLGSLVLGVTPVAGLLAEGARTLRESEFVAFGKLAALERSAREKLLVSSDRFVRPTDVVDLDEDTRRQLLARFGIYGVRLATSLVRVGVADSSELAASLLEQSGLTPLQELVARQFGDRSDALKVRATTDAVERLLRRLPGEEGTDVRAALERLQASAHDLKELDLLSRVRLGTPPLAGPDAAAAARLIGGHGTGASTRLGLPADAGPEALRDAALAELDRWRTLGASPLADRTSREACAVVTRSLEGLLSEVGEVGPGEPAAHVVAAGGPVEGRPEGADQ